MNTKCYLLLICLLTQSCHTVVYLPFNDKPYLEIETECAVLQFGLRTRHAHDGDMVRRLALHVLIFNDEIDMVRPYNITIVANNDIIYNYMEVFAGPWKDGVEVLADEYVQDMDHIRYYFELPMVISEVERFKISADDYMSLKSGLECGISDFEIENMPIRDWKRDGGWGEFIRSKIR